MILRAIDKDFGLLTTYRVLLSRGRSNWVANGRGGVDGGGSSVSGSGAAGNVGRDRAASNVGRDRAAGNVGGNRAASVVAVLRNGGSGSGKRKGGDCVTHFDCGGWY